MTAKGTTIWAEQLTEVTELEVRLFRQIRNRHNVISQRTAPLPRYNCHGLTFAARRTWLDREDDIDTILRDDGYDVIDPKKVLPGDIIVYRADDGMLEHSGIVLESPRAETLNIVPVLSKWGKDGEYVHHHNACPYSVNNITFYRIRT